MSKKLWVIVATVVAVSLGGCAGGEYYGDSPSGGSSGGHSH